MTNEQKIIRAKLGLSEECAPVRTSLGPLLGGLVSGCQGLNLIPEIVGIVWCLQEWPPNGYKVGSALSQYALGSYPIPDQPDRNGRYSKRPSDRLGIRHLILWTDTFGH